MELHGWNYRVLKTKIGEVDHYTIIEVYYSEDDKPIGWQSDFIKNPLIWDSYADLKEAIYLMQLAINKPILIDKDGILENYNEQEPLTLKG